MADNTTTWQEITSTGQLNAGWGVTFDANKRVPIIAKRRFPTLADAQGFVDDTTSTATEGIVLVVTRDSVAKNNGAYWVKKVANNDATYGDVNKYGELVKIGSDGSGSLAVETLTDTNNKIVEATLDNIGQIIYVKEGTTAYPSGPYIVTGDGTVARLGTTTPTGNLADDLAQALTDITELQNAVGDTTKGLVKQVKDLEDQQDDYLLKTDAATTGANKVLKTDSDGKITVDTTGNATTATEAKKLTDAPVLAASGADKITVQAGGKTSSPFTVPYATNAQTAQVAENLNWNNVATELVVLIGFLSEETFKQKVAVTEKVVSKFHINTLFVESVAEENQDTYFAVKFGEADMNTMCDILSVKSNGFVIPMVKDDTLGLYKSISKFAGGNSVDNIEITVKTIE